MADPKPNPEAGKKMQGQLGVIDVDSDVLREAARELQQHAESLSPVKGNVDSVTSTAESEASAFTETHSPAPVYDGAITALKTVGTKFSAEIEKVVAQLHSDAGALMWIADQHDSTETENRRRADQIDPNVTGDAPPPAGPSVVSV